MSLSKHTQKKFLWAVAAAIADGAAGAAGFASLSRGGGNGLT